MVEIFRDVHMLGDDALYDLWVEDGILTKKILSQDQGAFSKDLSSSSQSKFHKCKGLCAIPAGVDVQVHLRTPGQNEKENPETGIKAALHGGYGAVLAMPNTKPTTDCPEVLKQAQEALRPVAQRYGITPLFCSSVTKGLEGKELVQLNEMAKAGAAAFTDDGKGIESDDFMRAAYRASAETGIPVLQHAEWSGHGGVLSDCAVTRKLGLKAYDRKQEWSFVERDLKLLKEFPGARYHVLHVTTRESVELVRRAKETGLNVTAEASPHHLYFCADDIDPENTAFKMNPPLHQNEDREAIRKGLNEGVLDFVATDHAPHEASAKGADFAKAAFGTIGMESSLRVLLTGFYEGWINPDRMWDIFSRAPARFLGLEAEYGHIELGKPFRVAFFDPNSDEAFALSDIQSLSKNSCFLGVKLRGKLVGHFTKSGFFTL
ncbi:MAG: dihydroorotase [Bdellovibrionota bacterium]